MIELHLLFYRYSELKKSFIRTYICFISLKLHFFFSKCTFQYYIFYFLNLYLENTFFSFSSDCIALWLPAQLTRSMLIAQATNKSVIYFHAYY